MGKIGEIEPGQQQQSELPETSDRQRQREGFRLLYKVAAPLILTAVAWGCGLGEKQAQPSPSPLMPPTAGEEIGKLPTMEEMVGPVPTPGVEAAEFLAFEQIREKINGIQAPAEQKQETLAVIDKFEKVDQVLMEFRAAYQSRQEPDGTPSLLALTRRKFGQFLTTFPEFELENQTFFLKDEKLLRSRLNQLKETEGTELLSAITISGKSFFDERKPDGRRRGIYLEVGSKSGGEVEFDLTKTANLQAQEAAAAFKIFLQELGLDGNISFKVILTDKPSMEGATGTFFSIPEIPEIEIAPPFKKEVLVAELGHLIDIETNSRLLAYLTPEQVIDLLILREKALGDPLWGRRYPQIAKLFGEAAYSHVTKELKGQPLTVSEWAAAQYRPQEWLYSRDVDRFHPPENLDYPHSLKDLFDPKFTTKFDQELENELLKGQSMTVKDFIEAKKAELAELALNSFWDKTFVELLKESADDFYRIGIVGELTMRHLRRILFFDAAWRGDQRVAQLFADLKSADRGKILQFFVDELNLDSQLFSEAIKATVRGLPKPADPANNPYRSYLEAVISYLD